MLKSFLGLENWPHVSTERFLSTTHLVLSSRPQIIKREIYHPRFSKQKKVIFTASWKYFCRMKNCFSNVCIFPLFVQTHFCYKRWLKDIVKFMEIALENDYMVWENFCMMWKFLTLALQPRKPSKPFQSFQGFRPLILIKLFSFLAFFALPF